MSRKPDHSPENGVASRTDVVSRCDSAAAPRVMGDFELRREIGRGGMGTVYEAWQRSLKRTVAVKVLGSQISASPTTVERFQREAQAAAKLNHPHITPIFAQGEQDSVYYYAMELVDGPDLHTIISDARRRRGDDVLASDVDETVALSRAQTLGQQGKAPKPLAARVATEPPTVRANDSTVLMMPVGGDGSPAAHFAMIARHVASIADALDYAHQQGVIHRDIKPHNLILGREGRLRITDFGLARLMEQPGVTMTGEMIGSPLYMSPEQIIGVSGSVDHGTDIYSLGATMYEWMTLCPPYPGETRERVINQIVNAEPQAPRAINPSIPVDLETICLKAIERDREHRYRTGGELRDDLARFIGRHPIRAKRAGVSTRLAKFVGRHRFSSLASAAGVIAIALVWILFSKQGEIKTATKEARQATVAAAEAEAERDQILDLLTSFLPAEIGAPLSVAEAAFPVVQGLLATGQKFASGAGTGYSRGVRPVTAGTPDGVARRTTQDFYDHIVSIAGQPTADETDEYGPVLNKAVGHFGEREFEKALTSLNAYIEQRPDHFAARQLRVVVLGLLGQDEAMLVEADALAQLRRNDPNIHVWRGLANLLAGRFDQTMTQPQHGASFDAVSSWIQVVRALALMQRHRPTDAIAMVEKAIQEAPELMVARLTRAMALAAIGEFDRAIGDMSRVIEAEPNNADALVVRGQYHGTLGDFGAAAADLQQAMNIAGRTPYMSLQWAVLLAYQRRAEQAVETATEAEPPAEPNAPAAIDEEAIEASKQRIQQWFSRHVWPRTPDAENPPASSLQPQRPFGE